MPVQSAVLTTPPFVSIVVIHWNDEETTAECLSHLEKIEYDEKEILVVDSGSTDGSGDRIKERFPWVRLVTLQENRGHARAANLGVKSSREGHSQYIFVLDNDAFVEPMCLRRLVECMELAPSSGMATPLILSGRRPGHIWYGGGKITLLGNTRHTAMYRDINKVSLVAGEVSYASSCALLVRRALFEKLGGFNELLVNYSEDLEFSIKVRKEGYQILFEPSARVTHGESRNVIRVGGKVFRDYYTMRNRLYVVWKHGTLFQKTVGLMCTVVWYGVIHGMVYSLRGERNRTKALMIGIRDFAAGRMGWRVL